MAYSLGEYQQFESLGLGDPRSLRPTRPHLHQPWSRQVAPSIDMPRTPCQSSTGLWSSTDSRQRAGFREQPSHILSWSLHFRRGGPFASLSRRGSGHAKG